MRRLKAGSICEHEDCAKKATDVVYSRKRHKVVFCCEPHAEIVQDEGNPEYWHTCENCGCRMPIN